MQNRLVSTACIGVIVFTAIGSVSFIKYYWLSDKSIPAVSVAQPVSMPPSISVGAKMNWPDGNWSASDKTLLFVLSETCKFCNASAPFYERIVKEAKSIPGLRLMALLPRSVESAREYLKDKHIGIQDVRQGGLGLSGSEVSPVCC